MDLPLFVFVRKWKGNNRAPQELRHSGILSLCWAIDNDRRGWLFSWEAPSGTDAIDEICSRVFRNRGPVRLQDAAAIRAAFAERIYRSSTQISLHSRRYVAPWASGCFIKDDDQPRLYSGGKRCFFFRKTIDIKQEPFLRCRWCDAPTFYKPEWKKHDGTIRCNRPDCRRIDYLEHTPQSRGGIDLTPRQRQSLDVSGWRTQRLINYLILIAKEKRHGCKPTDDVRRRSKNHHRDNHANS